MTYDDDKMFYISISSQILDIYSVGVVISDNT